MNSHPYLRTLLVGLPRQLGSADAVEPMDRTWESGIFKEPVQGPVWLGTLGLEGDGVADRVHHGGPEKAVLAYATAHYPNWAEELSRPAMGDGGFGENFALVGLTEESVCIGDIYRIGGARVQVSQPRKPCWKLARRWRVKELALLTQESGRTGWYLRVLTEGPVQAGDLCQLEARPHPEWSVSRVSLVTHHLPAYREEAAALLTCEALTPSWREGVAKRLQTGGTSDESRRLHGPNQ